MESVRIGPASKIKNLISGNAIGELKGELHDEKSRSSCGVDAMFQCADCSAGIASI